MVEIPISFTIQIQVVGALIFVIMWFEDRRQSYLLWWSLAHSLLAVITAFNVFLIAFEQAIPLWFFLAFNVVLAFCPIAFLVAASQYRRLSRVANYLFYIGLLYATVLVWLALNGEQKDAQIIALGSVALAYVYTAWALWGKALIVRLTAIFFLLRAVTLVDFLVHAEAANYTVSVTYSMVLLPLATTLLLLLTMFHNFQEELKKHIGFLSLTQSFSDVLEGVTDVRQAGERLIAVLLDRQFWSNAGVFVPDENREMLYLVAGSGSNYTQAILDLMSYKGLPVENSMTGKAFVSNEIIYSYDVYHDGSVNVEQLRNYLKNVDEVVTQLAVPLHHDQRVLGVLIVSRVTTGPLSTEEIRLLENIGQIMGLTLANIEHMSALSYSASHDALTGLQNRAALHNFFENKLADRRFVLMLFDLNHFKEVNDTLGHGVGDSMLCALAERLETQLASNSVHVYRLGGDEFVVNYEILPETPEKEQLAEELSQLIAEVIYVEDLALRTTASIGVVDSQGQDLNSHELLRCADLAMYQAKSQGAPIAYYAKDTDNEVQKRVATIEGIANAIELEQLDLAFQPIVDLEQRSCHKCEALIRWHDPEKGVISAAHFMPIIETTHMISAITRIVAQKAIRAAKDWPGVVISVNLSARNLLDEKLVDFLLEEVAKHQLNPDRIQFEITETMLMADHVAAELVLNRLVDAGFTIALDDFGTGYSSLAYLSHFPIHTLKIDGSFTRKMLTDSGTRSIVESTIELCHKLGLDVVAEGVEETVEADALVSMGCHFAQGYLYAKPLPQAEFGDWLKSYNRP